MDVRLILIEIGGFYMVQQAGIHMGDHEMMFAIVMLFNSMLPLVRYRISKHS